MRSPAAFPLVMATGAAAWFEPAWMAADTDRSWTLPRETSSSQLPKSTETGWTPKPTPAPKALFGRMEVFPRAVTTRQHNTCGFDVNNKGEPYTCDQDGATCTFTNSYMGCCYQNLDYCHPEVHKCVENAGDSCDDSDGNTLCCSHSNAPSCYTWLLPTVTTSSSTEIFSLVVCTDTSGVGTLVDEVPHDSVCINTNLPTAKVTPCPKKAKAIMLSGGAIAGIVIGGVVAVTLIYVLFKRFRKRASQVQAADALDEQNKTPASPGTTLVQSTTSPVYNRQGDIAHEMSSYGGSPGSSPPPQSELWGSFPKTDGTDGQTTQLQTTALEGMSSNRAEMEAYRGVELQAMNPLGMETNRAEMEANMYRGAELQAVNPLGSSTNRAELEAARAAKAEKQEKHEG